jgi:hypothetical protein
MKQTYETPEQSYFVLHCDDRFSFTYDSTKLEMYPLIIELRAAPDGTADHSLPLSSPVSQFTIVQFTKVCEERENYRSGIVRQFFSSNTGTSTTTTTAPTTETSESPIYEFKDIYGIFDNEPDCVVCLCDPKEVTLLPCRHFCVCLSCLLKHGFEADGAVTPYSKDEADTRVARLVVEMSLPLSVVESRAFAELLYLLRPEYDLPSRPRLTNSLLPSSKKSLDREEDGRKDTNYSIFLGNDRWMDQRRQPLLYRRYSTWYHRQLGEGKLYVGHHRHDKKRN